MDEASLMDFVASYSNKKSAPAENRLALIFEQLFTLLSVGAGDEDRTRDILLGKQTLYH